MAEITPDDLDNYIALIRAYRDKFVAHLDEEKIANIPKLKLAEECVELLHTYIRQRESDSLNLPSAPRSYRYEITLLAREAKGVYESLRAT
jgi:hypothetical protein